MVLKHVNDEKFVRRIHSGFNVTENIQLSRSYSRIELKVNESMVKTKEISICIFLFFIVWSLHVIDVWFYLLRASTIVRFARSFVLQMYECRLISKYSFYIDLSRWWRPRPYDQWTCKRSNSSQTKRNQSVSIDWYSSKTFQVWKLIDRTCFLNQALHKLRSDQVSYWVVSMCVPACVYVLISRKLN